MTAPVRFPRFFVTNPSPCPYLPGKSERKVFTELNGQHTDELNDALGRIGFRRSQNVAYRPSCLDCKACVSVRVLSEEFTPSATQRKILRRNQDLVVEPCEPWATEEQFSLPAEISIQTPPWGRYDRNGRDGLFRHGGTGRRSRASLLNIVNRRPTAARGVW